MTEQKPKQETEQKTEQKTSVVHKTWRLLRKPARWFVEPRISVLVLMLGLVAGEVLVAKIFRE